MKEMKIKLTLTEEALGMMPVDGEIYENFIAAKAPEQALADEEIEAADTALVADKGRTVFPQDDKGNPFFWDYQIRGFFKDAIGMLRRIPGYKCAKLKNYKKVVDGLLFVNERRIPIHLSGPMGDCQRPLRAETMQGPRVTLACSETVPAGSWCELTIKMLDESLEDVVRECLDYGQLRGLAQWRNSGKGRFTWEEI